MNDGTHVPQTLIQCLQRAASSGDFDTLSHLLETLAQYPFSELADGDALRSAKNNLIAICGSASFVAVAGGADYETAQTLCDSFIVATEKASSVEEVLHLSRSLFREVSRIAAWKTGGPYSKLVRDTVRRILSGFSGSLSVVGLAEAAGISRSHLSARFREETGLTVRQFVARTRLAEARRLLEETTKPVYEVALETGFTYQNHFARVFRRAEGMSPIEYRNRPPHGGTATAATDRDGAVRPRGSSETPPRTRHRTEDL